MKVYLITGDNYGYYFGATDAETAIKKFCELTETKFDPQTEDIKEVNSEDGMVLIGNEKFTISDIMSHAKPDDEAFYIGTVIN